MRLYCICHACYLEDLRGLGASYRDGATRDGGPIPVRTYRITLDLHSAKHPGKCRIIRLRPALTGGWTTPYVNSGHFLQTGRPEAVAAMARPS